MKPTIGRIVHYRLSEEDATKINERRAHARHNLERMRVEKPGFQAHFGNPVAEGTVVAMVVTAVWTENCINGKCLLDGTDSYWVTSRMNSDDANGHWFWPKREEE